MPVDFSSSAFSSSGDRITYWSFANSYPLTVSSRGTTSFSLEQMYCCLRRDPHFLCSMLNDTLALDSADEYRLTGTDTRPNEMVAVAMGTSWHGSAGNGVECRECGNDEQVNCA